MLELCMSGKACKIFLLSSFAHTMKAFMGRLMWLLFLDSGKCREPARETPAEVRSQRKEQAGGHSTVLLAILTVHLTGQQSLVQPVGRGLLHPLLHWGRINPDVVLQESGESGTSSKPGSPPADGDPALAADSGVREGDGDHPAGIPHLAVGGAQRCLHGSAVAVQQLPRILDGFGDSVAFAQEPWQDTGTGTHQRQRPLLRHPAAPHPTPAITTACPKGVAQSSRCPPRPPQGGGTPGGRDVPCLWEVARGGHGTIHQ